MANIRLRSWQQEALDKLASHAKRDFLAVATPGAGKTTFALVALNRELHARLGPAVIVAPTAHLKLQWAIAANKVGLHLDPNWSGGSDFASDMHGIVTTYQQVASSHDDLRDRCYDGIIILDEVHHAGDDMAWGDSVANAFSLARRRISLSGTPFRSDTAAIPFVHYEFDEAVPDIEYGYGEALEDGIVRPVYFPRIDGDMEWVASDGGEYSASFSDKLNRSLSSQRLRTALSPHGNWLPDVLSRAHETLTQIREQHKNAGGLVICIDAEHAKAVAKILHSITGVLPPIALSEDPSSSKKISAFADSDEEWIVAVRMISEGVDIPRLRVGVYATTTTTELFFRQAVGRLVRVTPETMGARSVMYLPDDPKLRMHSLTISEPRRHLLKIKEDEEAVVDEGKLDEISDTVEQPTLFEALSSSAATSPVEQELPEWLSVEQIAAEMSTGFELTLQPPPTPSGRMPFVNEDGTVTPARALTKTVLRQRNSDLVRVLVRRTDLGPREVNAQLNKRVGIRRVNDATLDQLLDRQQAAQEWIMSL